jgi:hypothetical protein
MHHAKDASACSIGFLPPISVLTLFTMQVMKVVILCRILRQELTQPVMLGERLSSISAKRRAQVTGLKIIDEEDEGA